MRIQGSTCCARPGGVRNFDGSCRRVRAPTVTCAKVGPHPRGTISTWTATAASTLSLASFPGRSGHGALEVDGAGVKGRQLRRPVIVSLGRRSSAHSLIVFCIVTFIALCLQSDCLSCICLQEGLTNRRCGLQEASWPPLTRLLTGPLASWDPFQGSADCSRSSSDFEPGGAIFGMHSVQCASPEAADLILGFPRGGVHRRGSNAPRWRW